MKKKKKQGKIHKYLRNWKQSCGLREKKFLIIRRNIEFTPKRNFNYTPVQVTIFKLFVLLGDQI